MRRPFVLLAGMVLAAATLPSALEAQTALPRFAATFKVSSLGLGVEAATAVTARSNFRAGFSALNHKRREIDDGIIYDASLRLRNVQVSYDQYLFSGFHVGPGFLLYNGNRVDAATSVPAGQAFSLGGFQYFSNVSDPVSGTADVKLGRKAAPLVLLGFGNPLPRSTRRLGFNVDVGVVFQGEPRSRLNIQGTACAVSATAGCLNAADPTVQSHLRAEERELDDDLQSLRYYPLLSFGLSWKF